MDRGPLSKLEVMKDGRDPPFFVAGERILETGIYRVYHAEQVTHEVTLLRGEVFPDCQHCGPQVQFEFIRAAALGASDGDFKVRLYQVPHPSDSKEQQQIAAA